jgi:hypothetical protein
MKNLIYFLSFTALLFSCEVKLNEIEPPNDLISQSKMVSILEEIMLVENVLQTRYPDISQFHESIEKSGDHILQKHQVSFKQFDISIDYYASHQDQMKVIYDKVLQNMTKKLNKLEAEQKKSSPKSEDLN